MGCVPRVDVMPSVTQPPSCLKPSRLRRRAGQHSGTKDLNQTPLERGNLCNRSDNFNEGSLKTSSNCARARSSSEASTCAMAPRSLTSPDFRSGSTNGRKYDGRNAPKHRCSLTGPLPEGSFQNVRVGSRPLLLKRRVWSMQKDSSSYGLLKGS